jgi:hypothetical protein
MPESGTGEPQSKTLSRRFLNLLQIKIVRVKRHFFEAERWKRKMFL